MAGLHRETNNHMQPLWKSKPNLDGRCELHAERSGISSKAFVLRGGNVNHDAADWFELPAKTPDWSM